MTIGNDALTGQNIYARRYYCMAMLGLGYNHNRFSTQLFYAPGVFINEKKPFLVGLAPLYGGLNFGYLF